MSLTVKIKNKLPAHLVGIQWETHTWHIPFSDSNVKMVREALDVEFIYADGDEHEYIIRRFVNLPHAHGSTKWVGEMAKFIAANFSYL